MFHFLLFSATKVMLFYKNQIKRNVFLTSKKTIEFLNNKKRQLNIYIILTAIFLSKVTPTGFKPVTF